MRKRRILAPLAALATVGAALVVGAAPAQADPPGGTLRGVYYSYDFCRSYGFTGAAEGRWDWWYCEQSYAPQSAQWFLWTFDYS
ncbi:MULTISPECIES: hypothetical protein [unclassified Micromonospora]|uniref:hypothetical protein n=1 Tax=unclassified Micromonospora TaxID=2617518 RepID=UPI00103391D3|nr:MULTISPECIES: hypothetical protein [unclassified Micromonospora]QKW14925.1 hypothetical protein HUT12_20530 [Verrucosispora sp. NA02020]TBL33336.1 hypothetical protein EYA84_17540 [Verrucosispora sp. SN26_14.1]